MIKLTNILSESVGDTLNLATPVNRKILSLLYRYKPKLKRELKNYYRDSEGAGMEFKNQKCIEQLNHLWLKFSILKMKKK